MGEESKNQKPNFQYSVSKNKSSVNLKISNNFLNAYPKIVFKKRSTDLGSGIMQASSDRRKSGGLSNIQINKEASSSVTKLAEDYISFDYNCKSDNDLDKGPVVDTECTEKIPLENDPNGMRIKSLMEKMENLLRTPPVNERTQKIQQILRPQDLPKVFAQNCCSEDFVNGQPIAVSTVTNNHPEYFYNQFRPIQVPINIPTNRMPMNYSYEQETQPKNFSKLPAIELCNVRDGGGDCFTEIPIQYPVAMRCSRTYSLKRKHFKTRKVLRHLKNSKYLLKNLCRKLTGELGQHNAIGNQHHEVAAQMGKSANIINVEEKIRQIVKVGRIVNKGKIRQNLKTLKRETNLKTKTQTKIKGTARIEQFLRLEKNAKTKTMNEDKNSPIRTFKTFSLSIFYMLLFTVMFMSLIGPTLHCLG